jgi:hypothetical protein
MPDTYEQIVRELAEIDPMVRYYDGHCNFCGTKAIAAHPRRSITPTARIESPDTSSDDPFIT